MIPTVGRDLVARAGNRSDQLRLALRHPADDEARRPCVVRGEQREEQLHLPRHAGLEVFPGAPCDIRVERGDLEVFLDIDRKMMRDHVAKGCNGRARNA